MMDLFYQGGALFMGILTLIFTTSLVLSVVYGSAVFKGKLTASMGGLAKLSLIREVGIFGLMVGIFGQLIGLYDAFLAIQEMGQVSPAMLAGGLKVSMITTLYGFFIALISLLIYMLLKSRMTKLS